MDADFLDGDVEFTINEDYASTYSKWREAEEKQKLRDRYGDEQDLSSSSESEDEDAEKSNPEFDKEFLKTLSFLKSKNPVIYEKSTEFFPEQVENHVADKVKAKKDKPMYLKDYERHLILEKGGILTDEEDESEEKIKHKIPLSPSYVEEQKKLKESFKHALDQQDDDQDFLSERKKTKKEKDKEEEDFLDWLKGQKTTVTDKKVKKEMKFLHEYWNNPKLNRQEAFLKDFILNKRYLEHEDNDRIPTYNEIIHDFDELSDDEHGLENQDDFERKYNFRFEEPDGDFIKHYPRTMKDSFRREDDRRKKKRGEVKERKRMDKERKQEELKQLKAYKRKEIFEKLEKLQEIAGETRMGFDDGDLEGDFDPDAYDRKMRQMFDDDYYQMEGDEEKPEFPEDEDDDIVNWDKWQRPDDVNEAASRQDKEAAHCEDPEFNMDADYDPANEMMKEMLKASKSKKKKRKSKFAELASKKKPVFNPDNKTFEEYLDEYYKLDYEDIVGDVACRFKYRKVPANDFGLTLEEILVAKDKELNRWCSLKKTCQYRSKEDETYDIQAYQKKAANPHAKTKILSSVYESKNEDDEKVESKQSAADSTPAKKKKKKKRNKTEDSQAEPEEMSINEMGGTINNESANEFGTEISKKRKSKMLTEDTIKKPKGTSKTDSDDDRRKSFNLSTKFDKWEHKTAVSSHKKKSSDKTVKRKLSLSEVPEEKVEKKKKSKKVKQNVASDSLITNVEEQRPKESDFVKQKKTNSQKNNSRPHKRTKKNSSQSEQKAPVSDERLRAYGINPKKFKKKQIWKNMVP